ncbi:ileal sodium/bile acid cotransporter-like [Patiria miniata]|uniref:Uncharacterized protein n=1 Tax=Patiria miniata TaxID=46514 RepID=A0A914B5Z5_PATMI|nr:ileal sodium/bile acid cotransporter-like [Patiria miniata]
MEDHDLAHDDTFYPASTVLLVTNLQRYLLLASLALSSFLFGCKVKPDDFTKCVQQPVALWLSMMVSVILAPLTAYVLSLIIHLNYSYGLTLLITSICPAGALSPVFAYYTQADVCLCLSVFVLSTLMSVGMIPLGVFLCSRAYRQLRLAVLPNNVIVIALCVAIGCIAIGMTVRHRKQKMADKIVLALGYTPTLIIVAMLILVGTTIPHSMHFSVSEFFTVLLYHLILMSGTYILGYLSGQTHGSCRAMALSSASKSILLAKTIVHTSFMGDVLVSTLPIPTLFLIQYLVIGFLLSALHRIYRYHLPTPVFVQSE